MNKYNKADILLKENRVFLLTVTSNYEYYVCRGFSKQVYEIRYDKEEEAYTCTCKNMRAITCSHIEAVERLKEDYFIGQL